MMRFITPIVLTGIAIAIFLVFVNPLYYDISDLKTQVVSYDKALDNSIALENVRDTLTAKENAINPDNLTKLEKLLPENIDNIRLILEIQQIASPYGMTLSNVTYNTTDTSTTANVVGGVQGAGITKPASGGYGVFDLGFSTSGSYTNFINFTKDLQSNLRILDISSISFSSDASTIKTTSAGAEVYKYDFRIKTYWLKS